MRALNERGFAKNLRFSGSTALAERDRWCSVVNTSKTLWIFSRWSSGALWQLILFYWAFFETVAESRTDEVYGSLAYDGAPLLR